jgi:hypothetical protein
MDWRKWLCDFLACADCTEEREALLQCWGEKEKLELALEHAQEEIRQLELLVPETPPDVTWIAERDTAWVQSQLEAMKLSIVRLPLDGKYKLTNRKTMTQLIAWDTTNQLKYIPEFWDCDKFAMLFKIRMSLFFGLNQVAYIIDYMSGHSYNLILFTDTEPMILEPQSDGMYLWTRRLKDFYSLENAFAII